MSENNESKSYDDNPPNYEIDEPTPEIYLTNREVIYEPSRLLRPFLFIVALPILPFWWMWFAGKWLVQRLQR